MSVIAWDGRTLAADRQGTTSEMRVLVSKMRRLPDGAIVAWTGSQEAGLAMARWYENGANPDSLPPSQNKDDWSRLIVVKPDKSMVTYEQYGHAFEILDCPAAFGAGRDFALGAMAMGADARRAVEIACQFSVVCGMGVEAVDFAPKRNVSALTRFKDSHSLTARTAAAGKKTPADVAVLKAWQKTYDNHRKVCKKRSHSKCKP